MKRLIKIIIPALLILVAVGCANTCPSDLNGKRVGDPQFEECAGVYRLYPAADLRCGDAPKGYTPYYITHYGRHGSRYVIDDEQYEKVLNVLTTAAEEGMLTELGQSIYQRYNEVYPLLKWREGELSKIGVEQHKLIAKRMYWSYPEIFKKNVRVEAVTSMLSRTMMSMTSFCTSLLEEDNKLDIYPEATIKNILPLNPFTVQAGRVPADKKKYIKGTDTFWWESFVEYMKSKINTEDFINRLFTDAKYAETICTPLDFMRDLYYVTVHFQGTDEHHVSLADAFTQEELNNLWECDNAKYYMERGANMNPEYPSELYGLYILEDFIDAAERDLQQGRPMVRLRFGHDGCLMVLHTVMGLPGWSTMAKNYDDVKNVFQNYNVPMACNFQWVFYKGKSADDMLVRLYINEKVQAMPFEPVGDCYYKWNEVRDGYREIMKAGFERLNAANNN